MGTIRQLADRFRALDFEAIKQQALIETAPQIIPEMNEEQLKIGQQADGELLHPDLASGHYSQMKLISGGTAPYGIPDLLQSGNFYKGIKTTIGPKTINTFSIDTKGPALELKYSPLIYGANKANLAKYAIENLRPVLIEKLRAATVG